MVLHYNPQTTLREIGRQFTACFSHLKPQFRPGPGLKKPVLPWAGTSIQSMRLKDLMQHKPSGKLVLDSSLSVAAAQQRLQREFGVRVQMFRRAGDLWIEIHQTENLSLAQQNALGKTVQVPARFNVHTLFL